MDTASIVEDAECIPVYPAFNFVEAEGIITRLTTQTWLLLTRRGNNDMTTPAHSGLNAQNWSRTGCPRDRPGNTILKTGKLEHQ